MNEMDLLTGFRGGPARRLAARGGAVPRGDWRSFDRTTGGSPASQPTRPHPDAVAARHRRRAGRRPGSRSPDRGSAVRPAEADRDSAVRPVGDDREAPRQPGRRRRAGRPDRCRPASGFTSGRSPSGQPARGIPRTAHPGLTCLRSLFRKEGRAPFSSMGLVASGRVVSALYRSRVFGKQPRLARRPAGECSSAVRAAPAERPFGARGTERAFKAADPRVFRLRREIDIAAFTTGLHLEHVLSRLSCGCYRLFEAEAAGGHRAENALLMAPKSSASASELYVPAVRASTAARRARE